MEFDVLVLGAGAAGMMAAICAAECGAHTALLERNDRPGRKLYITGKGRCNVTNDCSADEVLGSVPHNSRFLFSAVKQFPPSETKLFFERLGVRLKTERGRRVFPESDRAADVIDALARAVRRQHVPILHGRAHKLTAGPGGITGVETEEGTIYAARTVILCTGGASYPATGSTGDGYRMAKDLGHTILPPKGSLVPLVAQDDCCGRMQGLALKNVAVKIKNQSNKVLFHEQGEMLFTHFGLSGPLILSASAHMRDYENEQYTALIDLKPALDEETLNARLLREFEAGSNLDFQNVLGRLLPRLMVPVMVERMGMDGTTKTHSVTKQQRRRLVELLKGFSVSIAGPRPVEEAIVTAGGIQVSEIDPKTMASKKVPGLYFAGEVIDVDAYTGGFNLQIAWSTGHLAGRCAAEYSRELGV